MARPLLQSTGRPVRQDMVLGSIGGMRLTSTALDECVADMSSCSGKLWHVDYKDAANCKATADLIRPSEARARPGDP